MPNAIFHAGARGVDRQPIFLTDHDRRFFIGAMKEELAKAGIATVAYALMPNHFHWEIATGEVPFDKAFHDAMQRHAVRFNRLYSRTGHLFEARHWSFQVEAMSRCTGVAAYIHLNPVKAKLVPTPSAWEWSSIKDWSGAGEGLVDFARIAEITGIDTESLKKSHQERLHRELARGRTGRGVEALVDDAAALFGLTAAQLRAGTKGRVYTLVKRRLIERCTDAGYSIEELARALNCTREALYLARKRAI
jgi:REP element-mobilizing transposase RayT